MTSLNQVLVRWDTKDQVERPCYGEEMERWAREAETVAEEGSSRLRLWRAWGFLTAGMARGPYGVGAGFLP
jgi:hypothetical protein